MQMQYGGALACYQRALDNDVTILGNDHPLTLDTINNIASSLGIRQPESTTKHLSGTNGLSTVVRRPLEETII